LRQKRTKKVWIVNHLALTFATRFEKRGIVLQKVILLLVITTLFLSHLSENKLKINKEKFGGFKKPLTFATRFEKSESSSKGFLQNNSQQSKFSYSVIQ
jgi:hypothetical protein